MKIFGSISELVDLAFRLAGGKQVRLLSRPQSEGTGDTIQAYIPDVTDGAGGTTGNSQDMVLVNAIQTLTNKTLTSPDINGGTIDNTVIGGSIPAAGSFTDIEGSTLDISGLASVQSFQVDSFSTAGLLHNNASGSVSSSLLVNADVDDEAQITLDKLQDVSPNQLLIGDGVGDIAAVSVKAGSDVSFTYDAGEVNVQINAGAVGNTELAEDIQRSKLEAGNAYRILANNGSGEISENAALNPDELVVTDANGQLTTVAGVDSTELSYLNGLTSNVQDQIDGKQDTITGGASTITSDNLTANRALLSDGSGKVAVSSVTNTQLEYLENTTSDIQAQLDGKANTSALGTIASQNADNVSITGGSLSGVELDVLDQEVESVAISSNSLSISKGVVNVSGTGPINTLSSSMDSGSLVFLRNASGADLVVSNGVGNILTGTGASFDLLDGAVAPFLYDGTNWNLAGGAGAGGEAAPGSGELNLIENPDADVNLNGWVDSSTGTVSSRTTTAAEIPLSPLKEAAIKILVASSGTNYTHYRFTMPEALKNRVQKIQWEQLIGSTYVAGDFVCELYYNAASDYSGGYTQVTLYHDSAIGAIKGQYYNEFLADQTYYELRIVQTTATAAATNWISLNNVIVGPGISASGALVGTTGSSSFDGASFTNDTGLTIDGKVSWQRIGDSLHVGFAALMTGNGTDTGVLTFDLASITGESISFSTGVYGTGWFRLYNSAIADTAPFMARFQADGTGILRFTQDPDNNTSVPRIGTDFGNTNTNDRDYVQITAILPVVEWAGTGTVNLLTPEVVESNAKVYAQLTASQTLSNSANITPVNLTASISESVSYDSVNAAVTVLASGKYKIELNHYQATVGTSTRIEFEARINSTGATATVSTRTGAANTTSSNSKVVELNQGDIIYLRFSSNGTGQVLGNATSGFTGFSITRIPDISAKSALGFGLATSNAAGLNFLPNGEIQLDTPNGHGSTNTRIRRWTNTVSSGTSMTYADSASLGMTITINEDGIYSMTYSDYRSGGNTNFGISLNSNQLTTNIASITTANRLIKTGAATGIWANCSVTKRLSAGDVIRTHTDGTTDSTIARSQFVITQVAKI